MVFFVSCHTHFCYLCGDRLPQANPYSHFNTLDAKCFDRCTLDCPNTKY